MPIDPRIALGVQPLQLPQQDPNQGLNSLARMMQIQGMQQEQGVNALKMDEMKRGVAEENQLRSLYGSPDFSWNDPAKRAAAFAASPTKAQGHYKAFVDAEKDRFTMAEKGYGIFQKAIGAHAANPNATKEGVLGTIQGLVQMGVMNPTVAGNIAQAIPDDPLRLKGFLRDALTSQMTGEQVLTAFAPKPKQIDNGQQISFVDENPNSPTYGKATGPSPVQKVATPDAMLSSTTSIENNKRTVGASLANAAATREIANATRDSARIQANQNTEMKMGDDYRAQSKPFKEVADAYRQINSTLDKATTSPAATLAAATKFMKLLDPGSVVRESELGMALAASGVIDRLTNYHNTLSHGKVLTPNQVQDFKQITQQIYTAAQQQQQQIDGNYRRQAETYGLRPNMVVQDLGQNTTPPVDLHALPSGGKSSGKVVNFGDLK